MIDWLTLMVAQERYRDLLREAEQERLIRAAKGPRKVRDQELPVMLVLNSLLALFMRPKS